METEQRHSGTEGRPISAVDARQAIGTGATAVDIRDDEAWLEFRVPGSIHFTEQELGDQLDELPRDGLIIVVCEDGERSSEVAARLRERDRDATSIEGGFEAWKDEDFPVQPSDDPDPEVRV
jgi:hydroxyacylglutathione hydrolase